MAGCPVGPWKWAAGRGEDFDHETHEWETRVSKDRFRGYHFQQLNHQRLSLSALSVPAVEAGVLLKLAILFGLSRQQFGLNDGSLSVSGKPMKAGELAEWLAARTPNLGAARAEKALAFLSSIGEVEISRAGVVKMALLASEQKDAPTEPAARKRRSRAVARMDKAMGSLAKVDGQVLEVDEVLFRVQGVLRCGREVADGVLKDLAGEGVVVPADGGLQIRVPATWGKPAAPSALPPPPVSEGPGGREGEVTCAHPAGVTCHNHNIISDHKRDSYESHDHDAGAPTRPMKESPNSSLRSDSGPGLRDGFADEEGGGGSAEGARAASVPLDRSGSAGAGGVPLDRSGFHGSERRASGVDAIYSCHHRNLAVTAVRVLGSSTPAKSESILGSKLRSLCDRCGPECGQQTFREMVHAIHTEMSCPGGQRLREPCLELTARINDELGLPRRQGRGSQGSEIRGHKSGVGG